MELNLAALGYRRKRFDIIQVFKIIYHFDDVDPSNYCSFGDNSGIRGHCLKLV